jgi:glycosyltransferase involved in cell wall biosynthesis
MSAEFNKVIRKIPPMSAGPIRTSPLPSSRKAERQGHSAPASVATKTDVIELSVVMPCLNEAETLAACIQKAQSAIESHNIAAEVIVADNGSTDASKQIAKRLGASVVDVPQRGYGNALMHGIAAARGRYVIMGDADDSYDFTEIPRFLKKLRAGNQVVQGCRLPSGGGTILPGAMPFLHRWVGNPFFSGMIRCMFRAPIHDVYCGMRGFEKSVYEELSLRCTGMEFATEMMIKSSLFGVRTCEIPITLHPDGRKSRVPHLRTFRDGWRTLRFFLMCSPTWLFFIPGLVAILLGVLGYSLALPGVSVGGAHLDAHTLLFSSLAVLLGYQSVLFSAFARTFAISEGLLPATVRFNRIRAAFTLERGLTAGLTMFLFGAALLFLAIRQWWLVDFGALDYAKTMRLVIPGVTLSSLGFQTVLSSFFLSILNMKRL